MMPESTADSHSAIWVVSHSANDDLPGRVGDARELADRSGSRVAVLRFGVQHEADQELAASWIRRGADEVHLCSAPSSGSAMGIDAALALWNASPPRLVIVSADRVGRAWSARLSARTGWLLVSPALLVQCKGGQWTATRIHDSGRWSQQVELPPNSPSIVAMRPGVAQPLAEDRTRRGSVHQVTVAVEHAHSVLSQELMPPDPRQADIRFLPKLIAGGKGVGGREGFEILRCIADKLGAGVAASRMAVDLGWIEPERQVGQTGKTVRPELYLACGISGASHHRDGMSDSRHVVAINTDPNAPLMQTAELALQADLHQVLAELNRLLESAT